MKLASVLFISTILSGCSLFQQVNSDYAQHLDDDALCRAMGTHFSDAKAFMVLYTERSNRGDRIDNERCFTLEQHGKADATQMAQSPISKQCDPYCSMPSDQNKTIRQIESLNKR